MQILTVCFVLASFNWGGEVLMNNLMEEQPRLLVSLIYTTEVRQIFAFINPQADFCAFSLKDFTF